MDGNKNSVRSLLANRPAPAKPADSEVDPEPEYQPYANGRVGRNAQHVLVFRLADRSVRAFAYSYFFGIESDDPAQGFTIDFGQQKVKIHGRNLEELLWFVCQFRVAEICEADRSQALAADAAAPVVERIDLLPAKPAR
jgi:hypothetical protein